MLLALAPPTPLALRLLPFVLGVLGVWLTWLVGKRVLGEVAGLVAAFLLAITPWHLFVSGMARYWSLVYVLAALGYLALHQAEQLGRTRDCVLAVGVWAVAGGAHAGGLFALPGVGLGVGVVGAGGGPGLGGAVGRGGVDLW